MLINDSRITSLCNEYNNLFEPGLGKILNYRAHIYLKPDGRIRFFKPRPVAFAIRAKIEADLDRFLKLGVIEQVQTAEFGATLVGPVAEPNWAVRICGDFKVTVNTYADMQRYPLPHPEELRAAIARGKFFQGGPRRRISANGGPLLGMPLQMEAYHGNDWSSLRTRGFFGILVFYSGFMVLPQFSRAPLTRFYKVLMELLHNFDDILVTGGSE